LKLKIDLDRIRRCSIRIWQEFTNWYPWICYECDSKDDFPDRS